MLQRFNAPTLPMIALLLFFAGSIRAAESQESRHTEEAAALKPNEFYQGNRTPLLSGPLIKLPVGAIRPRGWLRQQLVRMSDGFSGRLPEISRWCKFEGSAWSSPTGEGQLGWEELPYWLKGFTDLAYLLEDKRLMYQAKTWIDAILASQRPNGYFGPAANLKSMDIWPNMIVLYALRSHHEATGDPRVLTFMKRYFSWLNTIPLEQFLPGSWQKIRGGDNLDSIYWLYNHTTGGAWLLDLARCNHERTADWAGTIPTWHGVNLTQGFREPAQFYQQNHDRRYLNATLRNYHQIIAKYGQVPGGMFGADENAREGYTGPRQGAETCSMAEFMHSFQMLLKITGDRIWADRCEEVAFNSLPASMTPDLKGLHYLTAPNQVQLDRPSKAPMIENGGDMFSYNPHDYRCCQHNVAFGWPYFAEHLWMATPGNGLATVFYASCTVNATVGNGLSVRISEKTDYPFDDNIQLTVITPKPVKFPLLLRIPGWCQNPQVTLNDEPLADLAPEQGWLQLDRTWQAGDRLQLRLPMTIAIRVWAKNKNAISVDRGPLTYSLKIGERWQRYGGTDAWPAYEVFPTTPWNYGLVADLKNPSASFEVLQPKSELAPQPFSLENAPLALKAKGKRIPAWKQEPNGLIAEIQQSPTQSAEPLEELTLIPMGCARLRITAFPHLSDSSDAAVWK